MKLLLKKLSFDFILFGFHEKIENVLEQIRPYNINPRCIIFEGNAYNSNVYSDLKIHPKETLQSELDASIKIVVCSKGLGDFTNYCRMVTDMNSKLEFQCISIQEFIVLLINEAEPLRMEKQMVEAKEPIAFIDMQNGFIMGGAEVWAANLYHKLKKKKLNTKILAAERSTTSYKHVAPSFYDIPVENAYLIGPYQHNLSYVENIIDIIISAKPTLIINNGCFDTLHALYYLKKICGYKVKVISVLHSDFLFYYLNAVLFNEVVDTFFVVSDEIYEKTVQLIPNRKEDIKIKVQYPEADFSSIVSKTYGSTLKLAFAARLEKSNKRSHLLMDLVNLLEKQNVAYELHVAGEGECFEELNEFVKENHLEGKMILHGMIIHADMNKFWHDKHVYISLSLVEGKSLSLLEAMSQGLIPAVTQTSGVNTLVEDGRNGFIINSVEDLASCICKLSHDSKLCKEMVKMNVDLIHHLNKEDFADDFYYTET